MATYTIATDGQLGCLDLDLDVLRDYSLLLRIDDWEGGGQNTIVLTPDQARELRDFLNINYPDEDR